MEKPSPRFEEACAVVERDGSRVLFEAELEHSIEQRDLPFQLAEEFADALDVNATVF